MAKFHGFIGFVTSTQETSAGVFEEHIEVREYTGDMLRKSQRMEDNQKVNEDISLNVRVSIVADPFALKNLSGIRFVKFGEESWRVTDIESQAPRLILTIGGLYNA